MRFILFFYSGVPVIFPIPCACNDPSQHFLEYVLSGHKQARFVPFGDIRLGVLNFLFFILFIFW